MDDLEYLRNEIVQAKTEMIAAQMNFNSIESEYFDAANMALTEAIAKYNNLLRKYKNKLLEKQIERE